MQFCLVLIPMAMNKLGNKGSSDETFKALDKL